MSVRRLVILGASGRLGLSIAAELQGWPEIDLVRQARRPAPDMLHWAPEMGPDALSEVLSGADAVLNLIGATPAEALDDAAFERINCHLAIDILSAARAAKVRRILMASSAAVYGRPTGDRPFTETDPMAPVNAYGRSKAKMESAMQALSGPDLTVLRIGNVAGADALLGQIPGQSLPVTITLDRFADGQGPRRSYLGPRGLARIVGKLVLTGAALPGVLNVTAAPPLAMEALVAALNRQRPGTVDLRWRDAPEGAIAEVALRHHGLAALLGADLTRIDAETAVREWLDEGALD